MAIGKYVPGYLKEGEEAVVTVGKAIQDDISKSITTNTIAVKGDIKIQEGVAGLGGGFVIKSIHEVHTLDTSATSTTTFEIPTACTLLGVQLGCKTSMTTSSGEDTMSLDFAGGSTTSVLSGAEFSAGQTANYMLAPEVTTDDTTLVFDAYSSDTFATGVFDVIVYYMEMEDLT